MLDPDRGLLKRSCSEEISEVQGYQEILYRDVSYGGPVKRSCRELLYRDVSYGGPVKRSCRELV